jgi:alpha-beta hydrolase superfamily lysophospholipase
VAIFIIAALAVMGIVLLGYFLSHPVQTTIGPPPPDLDAQSISFPSDSGTSIKGWLSAGDERTPVVLLLPGVRANRRDMLGRARFLHRAGYAVMLIDLQATGESKGEAITFGWRERHDVLAAVAFLRKQRPRARVAIVGSSLGGAATLLATPPLDVDAMVLEAVFPTIERATDNRLRLYLGPIGSWLAPVLLSQLHPRLGVAPSQLHPADHAASVRCPVFVIAGAADRHTTVDDTRFLYSRFRASKALWLVPGAAHVDLHRASKAEYERRVLEFLNAVRASAGTPRSSP